MKIPELRRELVNQFARQIESSILCESNGETSSLYERNIKELFNSIKVNKSFFTQVRVC